MKIYVFTTLFAFLLIQPSYQWRIRPGLLEDAVDFELKQRLKMFADPDLPVEEKRNLQETLIRIKCLMRVDPVIIRGCFENNNLVSPYYQGL